MVLVLLIILLWKIPFALLLIYAIYGTILQILKHFHPVSKFTKSCNEVLDALTITEEEWHLEKRHENESIVVEGSTADGGSSIYIEIAAHKDRNEAHVILIEQEETFRGTFHAIPDKDDRVINCGPLLVEMRLPFRKWRILFRGILTNSAGNRQFVCFSGWWRPTSDAQFFYANAGLAPFLVHLKRNKFAFRHNIQLLHKYRREKLLSQFGQYHTELVIGGKSYERTYRGLRERRPLGFGCSEQQMQVYLDDGNRLQYKIVDEEEGVRVEHGIFCKASDNVKAIRIEEEDRPMDCDSPRVMQIKCCRDIDFPLRKERQLQEFSLLRGDGMKVDVKLVEVVHGLSKGVALFKIIRPTTQKVELPYLDSLPEYHCSAFEKTLHVLPFTHRACQDKQMGGGKGANLSRLLSVADKFSVPNGVVITIAAYEAHLQANPSLNKLISQLNSLCQEDSFYHDLCGRISAEFLSSHISNELIDQVREVLHSNDDSKLYAVRSSAVGEDGAELSSAGQMDTFLSVQREAIAEKVKLCWASNFGKHVITYRRNYAQQLNPSMAVVVQEMVSDGVAGVLFTADPVRSDPSKLIINALEGSGEQIVSGEKTPQQIEVNRIARLVVKPDNCCLSAQEIDKLTEVGQLLEDLFGRPQDIEFVMKKDRLFIVQSRDVTTFNRETNFEMMTEFNNSSLTEREIYTTANVGEVIPFPLSPFEAEACSLFMFYDKLIISQGSRQTTNTVPVHFASAITTFYRRVFLDCNTLFLLIWELMKKDRIAEIVVAGEKILTDEMLQQGEHRFGRLSKLFPLRRMGYMIRTMFYDSYRKIEEIRRIAHETEEVSRYNELPIEGLMALYEKQKRNLLKAISAHGLQSMFSSFTYMIVGMLIRGKEEGDMSAENLSDIAKIFSHNTASQHVISADVPAALYKLTMSIRAEGLTEQFLSAADSHKALDVISRGSNSARLLEMFFKMHGHRGPKELYYDARTWAEDPDLLVHSLRTTLQNYRPDEGVEEVNASRNEDIIEQLNCKPTGIRKKLMMFMINQTRRGVAFREEAKNHLVRTTHATRLTLRRLGQAMFEKGVLPDSNLWIHFTPEELREVAQTRDAKLIARAYRRKQFAPNFCNQRYHHVYHGPVIPIDENVQKSYSSIITLHGTTVCEGCIRGKARVAKSLEEARQTQPGEILITRHTDICWSPFFPIIKGIVTEIGGLLSHGAVVAREYGLPSLIAVANATDVFSTGDSVELNANLGTISKITEQQ